jgi:hypothetical protein
LREGACLPQLFEPFQVPPGVVGSDAPPDVLAAKAPMPGPAMTNEKVLRLVYDNTPLMFYVVESLLRMFRCASAPHTRRVYPRRRPTAHAPGCDPTPTPNRRWLPRCEDGIGYPAGADCQQLCGYPQCVNLVEFAKWAAEDPSTVAVPLPSPTVAAIAGGKRLRTAKHATLEDMAAADDFDDEEDYAGLL